MLKNILKKSIFLLLGFFLMPLFSNAQIIPFTGVPDIISSTVSNITNNSATLNGIVKANGADTSIIYEVSNGNKYPIKKIITGYTNTNLSSYNLTGLKDGTNYSFRIIASNSVGTTNGNWISFTTPFASSPTPPPSPATNAPTIISSTISNITTNSAVLNVTIKANGLNTYLSYEDNNGKTYQIKKSITGFSNINLDPINISGLNSNTNYSFRFVATNSDGITYGNWISFKTLSGSNNGGGGGSSGGGYVYVSVDTLTATNINSTSVILNASAKTHNLKTTGWFEYSTSSNFATTYKTPIMSLSSNNTNTPFSITIINLSPNTVYYFRAFAQGPTGTKNGNILSFKTLPTSINNTPINNTVKKNNNTYKEESSKEENIENDKENLENEINNQNRLTANTLNSAYLGFLPSTFIGWLTLVLIIFAIILLIKEILITFKRKSKEKSADDIDNLPM